MTLEADLDVLLQCWRRTKHPRVGDTLDRVSRDLVKARGPVPGKTITARIANLLELTAKKDPADLGRLLDVPWPASQKNALPVSKALRDAFGDDPRLEAHLAKTFAEPPWKALPSYAFLNPVLYVLFKATDARVIPALEAGNARTQPAWYSASDQARVREAIARLKTTPPTELNPAELAVLAPIEARYAEAKARETDKARGEAQLLENIYARPHDAQARAVFADWLTERNDPRGECIALQLASERTRAQQSRLTALLEKHGADWAGSLDEWFHRDARRFELGFLAGGKMVDQYPRSFDDAVKDPLWKLVTTIEHEGYQEPPPQLLPQLRELYGARPFPLRAALNGERPVALEVLTFSTMGDSLVDLGECSAAKQLRTIGFPTSQFVDADEFEKIPLLRRVEKIIFHGTENLAGYVAKLVTKFPNVKTVEVLSGKGWLFPDGAWRCTLSREGPGPFTSVTGYTTSTEVLTAIAATPEPAKVKSVRIEANRTLPVRQEDRENAEKILTQLSSAKIEVPWERERAAPVKKATGELVGLRLHGASFLSDDMQPLWSALTDAGVSFDSYSVGDGGAHRPLGAKPVATLSKWGANKRTKQLELYRDGTDERLTLLRPERMTDTDFLLEFHWNETRRTHEAFIAWVESLLAIAGGVQSGALEAKDERYMLFGSETVAGRLNFFGGEFRKRLPEKKVIAAVKKLGGFAHAGKHALYFGSNSTLKEKVTDAGMRDLKDAVWPLIIEHFVERTGLDFHAELEKSLWKTVGELGFTKDTSELDQYDISAERGKGEFRVNVAFYRFFLQPMFRIELRKMYSKDGFFSLRLTEDGNLDQATFRAGLNAAATMLTTEGPRWMEDPQKYKPRRGR